MVKIPGICLMSVDEEIEKLRAAEKAQVRLRSKAGPRCFVPRGRTESVIYAVTLKEHPGVTKVGRTRKWSSRRKDYDTWNLSSEAIEAERIFCITEDYVDIAALEEHILDRLPFPRRFGREWLVADIEDVARLIDQMLCEAGLSYV
jgi:hypothetical protein